MSLKMRKLFLIRFATIVLGQVDLRIPVDVDHRTGHLHVNGPMPLEISVCERNYCGFRDTFAFNSRDWSQTVGAVTVIQQNNSASAELV
jgi:hypothetical protein